MGSVRHDRVKGTFHIAEWEVQPEVNCLKTADRSVHVEPKVMQVLVELATHSNEVLTKEQLIQAVWSGTFVSDDALTRCISEIRRVLADDARAPRFIQTIPKSGYRFIAPVAYDQLIQARPPSPPQEALASDHQISAGEGVRLRRFPWALVWGVIAFTFCGVLIFQFASRQPASKPEGSFKVVPFTSYPGIQTQPAFSPDGNQVAFVWNGEKDNRQHVYIKMIGNETPLRVTSDAADDFSPVWSPDGRSLAFFRESQKERGTFIVPALGGTARKIFTPMEKTEWERGALSWSPDGTHLLFPDGKSSRAPSKIYSLDLANGNAKPITAPPSSWDGDASPAFSPDGKKIAFVRGIEGWIRDIYVMDSSGGVPVRLTFDDRIVSSVAWTADSGTIVFSSNRAGKDSLWSVPVSGGSPERLPIGGDASNPTIAKEGNRLAYAQSSSTWSIRQVDLKNPKASATTLWSSSEADSAPKFSPDGSRVAFQSLRSGTQEIWAVGSNGVNPVKLTSFEKGLTGSPSWSPDGSQLTFDARLKERSHIYSIRLEGGAPQTLTAGDFNDILPRWSPDGRWIYFGSNRSGAWQIWRVPSVGGTAEQVTRQGGFVGVASLDGQWLYFAKDDAAGIWRVPIGGGDEQQIVNQPANGYWGYWDLVKNGIYYLDQSTSPAAIGFADLNGGHRVKLHTLDHNPPPFAGITVAPDESFLLYNEETELGSHITLVDGFR
jgi:Tol biopolymer transport system component/DNA-binding winged helix-turn-helix (wHTH) protein